MGTDPYQAVQREVRIPCGSGWVVGDLGLPAECGGLVLVVHDDPAGRHSARARLLAARLHTAGLATLVFDLQPAGTAGVNHYSGQHQSDLALLTQRVQDATTWAMGQADLHALAMGYLGLGAGSAAALIAAAHLGTHVSAVVAHEGRPDLAGHAAVSAVIAPTLLLCCESSASCNDAHRLAYDWLECTRRMEAVAALGSGSADSPALEQVGTLAGQWFARHLVRTVHPV